MFIPAQKTCIKRNLHGKLHHLGDRLPGYYNYYLLLLIIIIIIIISLIIIIIKIVHAVNNIDRKRKENTQ